MPVLMQMQSHVLLLVFLVWSFSAVDMFQRSSKCCYHPGWMRDSHFPRDCQRCIQHLEMSLFEAWFMYAKLHLGNGGWAGSHVVFVGLLLGVRRGLQQGLYPIAWICSSCLKGTIRGEIPRHSNATMLVTGLKFSLPIKALRGNIPEAIEYWDYLINKKAK